jgi:hypothetical protein
MVCFFEFLTPSTMGGYNFLNSIPFWKTFSALDVPIGGVQVFLEIKNNGLSFWIWPTLST